MSVKKIARAKAPHPFEAYSFAIRPLAEAEGGGYLITFPDLPGCVSDGDSIEAAIENGRDAFHSWISATVDMGLPVPEPSRSVLQPERELSGRFVQRVPKRLHAELAARAREEGVSLNSLALAFLAEGLGRRAGTPRRPSEEVAEPAATYRADAEPKRTRQRPSQRPSRRSRTKSSK